ncbi:unnamed protein product [Paramecium pentaurelia]|uniref:EF-hand domain-containing protein n=1 Tax=Paramecium pentaurelia TaxID=43138 RepID=A0A8S1VEX7_9CILI|nr:unnamed protein product [Paramecium pentaurelia]
MINLSVREQELIEQICSKNNKQNKNSKQVLCQQKLISQSSTKLLATRLEQKLNEIMQEIDEKNEGSVNMQQMGRIFTLLDIFQTISYDQNYEMEVQGLNSQSQRQLEIDLHEKAFAIISQGKESADIQAAFCFFRIIQDPNNLEATKSASLMIDYLEKILEKEVDKESILRFCQEFQHYQKTRLSGAKTGYLKANLAQNLIDSYEKTHTFKPSINPISEALLRQSYKRENQESQHSQRSSDSKVSQLYKKKQQSNQKINQLKLEQETQEMKECTFKPQIISKKELPNVVDRLYKVKTRQEVEEQIKQNEIEKLDQEFSKCSFQPQINGCMPDMEQVGVNGYGQAVERLRRANDQRYLREIQLNHKPSGEKYEKVKRMAFIPPDMLQRSKVQKEIPILYIDIKIGPSKVGRLALRKNDNVEEVVKSFCKVWGVALQDYDLLVNQVKENLKNVITESEMEDL